MENRSRAEVGALVKARRLELRITEKQLQAVTKIDPKTLKKLESGERWPQEETRMKVEVELQWMPGSIQALLEGGAATPMPPADEAAVEEIPPLRVVSDEELLNEVWRRLEGARSGASSPVAADERKHPVPGAFFGRTDASDPGEAGRELRRQQGR